MLSKTIKFFLILSLGLCLVSPCSAQDQNSLPSVTKRNAISFNIAGTTPFAGITYERLLSDRFNMETGLGVYSFGVAVKYFPYRIVDNKMVLHLVLGSNLFATPFDTFASGDVSSLHYFTLGLTYFGGQGFNFGLDLGPSINYDYTFKEVSNPIYGNLKLGYRF